jgi:hypothetical protein
MKGNKIKGTSLFLIPVLTMADKSGQLKKPA